MNLFGVSTFGNIAGRQFFTREQLRMNKYKDLYKWMIIPLVIMQLGI
ncbi:MAG: hypothetical protein ABIV48_11710 [Pyrinomonadaceae bacterium]